MKQYKIAQLWIPPDKKYDGVVLLSTDNSLVNWLLPEIKNSLPPFGAKNAKFTQTSNSIKDVTTGRFELLSNHDSAVGWLIVKLLSEKGWELFSTSIDGGYTSHCFRYTSNFETTTG